jgi:hypothetical protein
MSTRLHELLDYLAERLDRNRLRAFEERACRSLSWEEVDRPPVIVSAPLPPDFLFQPLPMREIFDSSENMLYNELVHAFELSIAASHRIGHDLPWSVRANFGTVLVASMYGARVEQVGDNPPWVLHEGAPEIALESIAAEAPESLLTKGWLPRVRETMEAYHAILAGHTELAAAVRITLPDIQGPFDNFEHVRGNRAFLDLIDNPEASHAALRHVAATQIAAARSLAPLVTDGPEGFCHQHGFPVRGHILLRCDSVIMLSAEMYRDQVAPHDDRVMEALGGGGIHSCGDISHLAPEYLKLPALQSLDLGQSELNDRNTLYEMASERKTSLIRIHTTAGELASGQFRERFPTGVAAIIRAATFADAGTLSRALRKEE